VRDRKDTKLRPVSVVDHEVMRHTAMIFHAGLINGVFHKSSLEGEPDLVATGELTEEGRQFLSGLENEEVFANLMSKFTADEFGNLQIAEIKELVFQTLANLGQ
jgi:hypothetical protein